MLAEEQLGGAVDPPAEGQLDGAVDSLAEEQLDGAVQYRTCIQRVGR
jgi:hypothetical protein